MKLAHIFELLAFVARLGSAFVIPVNLDASMHNYNHEVNHTVEVQKHVAYHGSSRLAYPPPVGMTTSHNGFYERSNLIDRIASLNQTCGCKRRKCARNRIKDSSNCRKCSSCPNALRADPTHTFCYNKEEKYKTKKRWVRKDGRYQEFKATAVNKERMKLRLGSCIALVATSLGDTTAAPYLAGFFDEDFLTSDDVLGFWTGPDFFDSSTNIGTDDVVKNSDFIQSYVDAGNNEPMRRSLLESDSDHTKRQEQLGRLVKPALMLAKGLIGKVKEGWNKVFHHKKLQKEKQQQEEIQKQQQQQQKTPAPAPPPRPVLDKNSFKIADGKSAHSRQEQKDAMGNLTKDKNWTNCLKGQKAEK